MHVTLKFIGHVEATTLDSIRDALGVVRLQGPVEMRFRGARFFPSERFPRVLASEVEASPNIGELAAEIERALVPLGVPAEGRAFVPHLTLARLKSGTDTEALVKAASEMAARDFGTARARATEFHLFESFLRPSGAEHRRVESYPLMKAAT
jgi:2'-5' RNA ligase